MRERDIKPDDITISWDTDLAALERHVGQDALIEFCSANVFSTGDDLWEKLDLYMDKRLGENILYKRANISDDPQNWEVESNE